MGWSATAAACEVMDALYGYCRDTDGSNNSWVHEGRKYFAERGKEHQDGHISMTIYRMVEENLCRRSGSIYIEPDGKIRRMPAYLKRAIQGFSVSKGGSRNDRKETNTLQADWKARLSV